MKTAFALLCLKPNKDWLDFISNFHYDCYVIVDDNYNNYEEFKSEYKNITFIQIDDNICLSSGYKNAHSEHFYKKKNTKPTQCYKTIQRLIVFQSKLSKNKLYKTVQPFNNITRLNTTSQNLKIQIFTKLINIQIKKQLYKQTLHKLT